MCRITSKAHAQCTEKLSRLRSSMHALISCELAFTQARSQHNHPRVRVRRTHCQTPSSGGSHKLPAWRATTTPALHRLHRSTAAAMCRIISMAHVRQAESCCSHVQDSMAHAQCTKQLSRLRPSAHAFISCVASTLQWPASTFRGNKQREILKSSNGMKTFDLQAFALHGSRCMLTHFSGANIEHWTQNSMQYFSGANIAILDPETASASA